MLKTKSSHQVIHKPKPFKNNPTPKKYLQNEKHEKRNKQHKMKNPPSTIFRNVFGGVFLFVNFVC